MIFEVKERNIADKTLLAMNESIEIDQGKTFKQKEKEILPLMTDAYENGSSRKHLGASVIGGECERKIWLQFRKYKKESFSGAKIRLFNRGHLEEGRIIANLESAGIKVSFIDENRDGKQFGGKIGWFGSSIDGLTKDTKEYPDELVILEFKTMNEKRFNDFVNFGIEAKFDSYYKQAVVNIENINRQYGYNINKVLFIAVNKNNDEIFAEYVKENKELADSLIELANNLATTEEIPFTIKPNQAFYPCKFCDYKGFCFGDEEPQHCCRTCLMCKRTKDGKETCELNGECNFSENCYTSIK